MKPLKLTMTAFGPYKDQEVIDFTELKNNRLFVVSGKTGAGKTTIFDGICFALYGAASGEDRSDSKSLRSDFADDDVHTAVELEFELRGHFYRIKRQLGHVKKGNKTATGEQYEFYEKMDDEEVPCVDRQIVSEINKKAEELLGLTKEQFIQIVMLPQGEFRKLLTSDTENKEEILRRIFKTERYTLITQRLKDKKQEADVAYKGEKQALDRYIQEIPALIPERDESQLFQVLSQENYNAYQVLTALEEEKVFYEEASVRNKEKETQAESAYNKKLEEFHKAESLNEEFNRLEEKETQLSGLLEQKPLFIEKEVKLQNAERASKLQSYETQVSEWRKDVIQKQESLKKAKETHDRAVIELEKAQFHHKQEEKKQDEREKAGIQLGQYQELLPIVEEMDRKKSHLEKENIALKKMAGALDDGRKKKQQYSEANLKLKNELKNKEEKVDQLPEKTKRLLEMREMVKVLKEYLAFSNNQNILVEKGKKAKSACEKAKQEHETIESAWTNSQAAVLAASLHDGQPCPVCGSKEHPDKAHDGGIIPTIEEREEANKAYNDKNIEYSHAVAEYRANKKQLDGKADEIVQFGLAIENASAVFDKLAAEGKSLKNEVDLLEEERKALGTLRDKLKKQEADIVALEAKLEQWSNDYQTRNTTFEAQKAVYQDQLKRVPEELRNLSELKNKIAEIQAYKEALEKAWKTAQEQWQTAQTAEVKAKANWENAGGQLNESTAKKEKAEQQFLEALKEAEFVDEESYRQAKMTDEAIKRLKAEIESFLNMIKVLDSQVNELEDSLKDKTKADMEALKTELAVLKEVLEKAQELSRKSGQYLEAVIKQKEKISESNEQVARFEKRLNIVTDLYDVIRGQNSRKISFERYLQIEYLEQILVAANERLKKLSNGQYALIRSDRQESRGKQSGLGLDVYDAYTGQTRDVKTLSGGEKFNASLSLALGMADVIQSFQGGVSIDTMFIDEGFGSLDDESLTKAIDTLIDLQQSGRMIGVISHVQELKNTIPAVLEVYKMKEGYSRTRFEVK